MCGVAHSTYIFVMYFILKKIMHVLTGRKRPIIKTCEIANVFFQHLPEQKKRNDLVKIHPDFLIFLRIYRSYRIFNRICHS